MLDLNPRPRPVFPLRLAFLILLAFAISNGRTAEPATSVKPAAGPASAPASTNAVQHFQIKSYNVEGNTLLPSYAVDAAIKGHTGDDITFDEVRAAVVALTQAYRDRGWETVSVFPPPQKLTNGVLTLKVVEGKLVEINVVKNRYFSKENVLRALPGLHTNTVLNTKFLQPQLDQANLNPDRQIYPIILPGPEPGTSALNLRVNDSLPLHGRVDVNNSGTPGTPSVRINSSVQYMNLWDREHQAGFQYGFSPEDTKDHEPLGRFYDMPKVANYSVYYRIPLPSTGETGAGNEGGAFGYNEVTRKFQSPATINAPDLTFYASRSFTDTGIKLGPLQLVGTPTVLLTTESQSAGEDFTYNDILGAKFSKPMPVIGGFNSTWSLSVELKYYNLSSFNTNNFYSFTTITNGQGVPTVYGTTNTFAEAARRPSVTYLPVSFHWDASRPDRSGTTSGGFGFSMNIPTVSGDPDFASAAYSAKATASYGVFTFNVMREQKLPDNWTLILRADGQAASSPLISNEQFGLGGSAGVRGYFEGEAYGDAGWRFTIEPRSPSLFLGSFNNKYPVRVRFSVFNDYGELYKLDQPNSRLQEWGAGAGFAGNIGQNLDFRFSVGWALLNGPLTHVADGNVYFGFGAQF